MKMGVKISRSFLKRTRTDEDCGVFLVKSVESSFGRRWKDDQSWQNRIKQTKAKKKVINYDLEAIPKKTLPLTGPPSPTWLRKPPAMPAKSLFQKLLCRHVDPTPVLWFGRHAIGVSPENLHVNPWMCSRDSVHQKLRIFRTSINKIQDFCSRKSSSHQEIPGIFRYLAKATKMGMPCKESGRHQQQDGQLTFSVSSLTYEMTQGD